MTGQGKWQRVGCETASCPEIMRGDDGDVFLRSSITPTSVIVFTRDEWNTLVGAIMRGEVRSI